LNSGGTAPPGVGGNTAKVAKSPPTWKESREKKRSLLDDESASGSPEESMERGGDGVNNASGNNARGNNADNANNANTNRMTDINDFLSGGPAGDNNAASSSNIPRSTAQHNAGQNGSAKNFFSSHSSQRSSGSNTTNQRSSLEQISVRAESVSSLPRNLSRGCTSKAAEQVVTLQRLGSKSFQV
jgi:hypothetical protein